jgi:peptide/nickel transport system substrate-binding protein
MDLVEVSRLKRLLPAMAAAAAFTLALPGTLDAQGSRRKGTSIVIVTGGQATLPIPTLMEGPEASVGNFDVADQLFLRLADLGPKLLTAGEGDFVPALARSWTRRDSVTLAFDLDARARWHDGTPVTAQDVVFTMARAKNPALAPRLADLLRQIVSVNAEGSSRVVFRFARPYAEQLYDATFHVAPLPAHLLDTIPPAELARSEYAKHPVGSGPYRWVRNVPGQFLELAGVADFFLGRPEIERVIFRTVVDATARLNLLLSGQADAMDIIPPPADNIRRVGADTSLRLISVPSSTVGYLLFNQRDPQNRARPHPILADIRVRRAITLALDRRQLVQAVFGSHGVVPYGPVSQLLWIREGAPEPEAANPAEARRLLASTGWGDSDGDGTLDRRGQPLRLLLSLPNTSALRRHMALLIQQQLRSIGIQVDIQQLEFPVWQERRVAGAFDLDFAGASQDASPSGLTQSWTCTGGNNVSGYCDRRVDSLMYQAILGRGDPAEKWNETLRRIEEGAPAVFLYAPTFMYAVNRRYRSVTIRPHSGWITLRKWSVSQDPVSYRDN